MKLTETTEISFKQLKILKSSFLQLTPVFIGFHPTSPTSLQIALILPVSLASRQTIHNSPQNGPFNCIFWFSTVFSVILLPRLKRQMIPGSHCSDLPEKTPKRTAHGTEYSFHTSQYFVILPIVRYLFIKKFICSSFFQSVMLDILKMENHALCAPETPLDRR